MTQTKLFIYNYGSSKIADFGTHYHEAIQCMKALNDSLILSRGYLPDSIFYYTTCKRKGRNDAVYFYVDSTNGLTIADCDKRTELLNNCPVS